MGLGKRFAFLSLNFLICKVGDDSPRIRGRSCFPVYISPSFIFKLIPHVFPKCLLYVGALWLGGQTTATKEKLGPGLADPGDCWGSKISM